MANFKVPYVNVSAGMGGEKMANVGVVIFSVVQVPMLVRLENYVISYYVINVVISDFDSNSFYEVH